LQVASQIIFIGIWILEIDVAQGKKADNVKKKILISPFGGGIKHKSGDPKMVGISAFWSFR